MDSFKFDLWRHNCESYLHTRGATPPRTPPPPRPPSCPHAHDYSLLHVHAYDHPLLYDTPLSRCASAIIYQTTIAPSKPRLKMTTASTMTRTIIRHRPTKNLKLRYAPFGRLQYLFAE